MKSESYPLLTKSEAADFLGIRPRTLDDWRTAGAIACVERPGYVRFLRTDHAAMGETPTLRRVSTQTGTPVKELFGLFPGKPAKKMAYVSGLPKPKGCV